MAWRPDTRLLGDYGGQALIWLSTSAVFPAVVFYGFVLAGDTKEVQIGRGQLLLVAAALTAPILGVLITLPGSRNFGRSLLFFAAFVHVSLTVFYFAAVADGTRDARRVAIDSLWLYLFAVVIGVCAVLLSGRAVDRRVDESVVSALRDHGIAVDSGGQES